MGRRSKIATSMNRITYEELRAKGATYDELHETSKRLGENISRRTFVRYFTMEVQPKIEQESERRIKTFAEDKFLKQTEILNKMESKLGMVDTLITNVFDSVDLGNPASVNSLTKLLQESRMMLRDISELRGKLEIKEGLKPETVVHDLIILFNDLPKEAQKMLKDKIWMLEKKWKD